MTLKDALERNKGIGPGFHWMRHALAIGIVAHHCRAAVYFTISAIALAESGQQASLVIQPTFSANDIIRPALFALVATFFALSGFLVAGSAIRNPNIRVFFANRVLRILPALTVEVALSALVLGAFVTTLSLSEYYSHPQFFRYFGNIVGMVTFHLPGVFEGNPWPGIVNGNLWTLPPEFWCYAIMLVAMYLGLLRKRRTLLIVATIFMIAATIADALYPETFGIRLKNQYVTWYITTMFCIGVLYFLYADKVILRFWMFIASVAIFWCTVFFGVLAPLGGIFLSYAMVYVGMLDWKWWNNTFKSDYSYGIYLYGFPIMQTIVYYWQPHWSAVSNPLKVAILFVATVAITLVFSALSWRFIEKPALSLRSRFDGSQKARVKSLVDA